MGVILEEPKHKVIDPSPSLQTTIANFNAVDLLKAAAFTGAAVALGYSTGKSKQDEERRTKRSSNEETRTFFSHPRGMSTSIIGTSQVQGQLVFVCVFFLLWALYVSVLRRCSP